MIGVDSDKASIRQGTLLAQQVLYGEGLWSRPPTPEAVAPLSGRLDELVTLAKLIELP